jgi:hypothetical protein
MAPLFLHMGMLPVVVASTNQFIAMISTIAVTCQYSFLRMLNLDYCLFLGTLIVIASVISLTQVNKLITLTGRQSIIVLILALVLFISFVSLPLKFLIE